MNDLTLHVKDIYFKQAKSGIKTEEYRSECFRNNFDTQTIVLR